MILTGTTFLGFQNHCFQAWSCSFLALSLSVVSGQCELLLQITASKEWIPCTAIQVLWCLWEGGKVENQ